MDGVRTTRASLDAEVFHEVFERLSLAVLIVDRAGAIVARNAYAGELLGTAVDDPGVRCCDLLACARETQASLRSHGCITAGVLEHGGPLNGIVWLAGVPRSHARKSQHRAPGSSTAVPRSSPA